MTSGTSLATSGATLETMREQMTASIDEALGVTVTTFEDRQLLRRIAHRIEETYQQAQAQIVRERNSNRSQILDGMHRDLLEMRTRGEVQDSTEEIRTLKDAINASREAMVEAEPEEQQRLLTARKRDQTAAQAKFNAIRREQRETSNSSSGRQQVRINAVITQAANDIGCIDCAIAAMERIVDFTTPRTAASAAAALANSVTLSPLPFQGIPDGQGRNRVALEYACQLTAEVTRLKDHNCYLKTRGDNRFGNLGEQLSGELQEARNNLATATRKMTENPTYCMTYEWNKMNADRQEMHNAIIFLQHRVDAYEAKEMLNRMVQAMEPRAERPDQLTNIDPELRKLARAEVLFARLTEANQYIIQNGTDEQKAAAQQGISDGEVLLRRIRHAVSTMREALNSRPAQAATTTAATTSQSAQSAARSLEDNEAIRTALARTEVLSSSAEQFAIPIEAMTREVLTGSSIPVDIALRGAHANRNHAVLSRDEIAQLEMRLRNHHWNDEEFSRYNRHLIVANNAVEAISRNIRALEQLQSMTQTTAASTVPPIQSRDQATASIAVTFTTPMPTTWERVKELYAYDSNSCSGFGKVLLWISTLGTGGILMLLIWAFASCTGCLKERVTSLQTT